MTGPLKRTPFYDFHVLAGGRMVEFAGWEMPIVYRSIADEHEQTRKSGSIFDVSHMGRVQFSGPDSTTFLQKVLTRNVAEQKVGQSRYSLVCNPAGGVMDDVIVSRDTKRWLMVCNASNREKLLKHFHDVRHNDDLDFDMADQTESTAMVAIQGPRVIERIGEILPVDVRSMKRYTFQTDSILLTKFTVFRSGYTGEDGVELILPAKAASMGMKMLSGQMSKENATIKPAGLGARDTLRMEAAMPLYGHELTETTDPLSAGLGWAVDLNKDFIGADALRKIHSTGPAMKLVGLFVDGPRSARQGMAVHHNGTAVGTVTSGTMSPTLKRCIALAYVDPAPPAPGPALSIDIRGTPSTATVTPLPFYKRPK